MRILYLGHARSWHLNKWLEYYAEAGHELFMFSEDPSGIPHDIRMPEPVRIRYFSSDRVGRSLLLARSELRAYIREIRPDVMHSHNHWPYGVWGALSAFNPHVFTPQGSDILILPQEKLYINLLARFVYKHSDSVMGDSRVLQRAGYRLGASRRHNYIVQYGADLAHFRPDLSTCYIKKLLDIPDHFKVVLSPRAISSLYNIDTIIESLPSVIRALPNVVFVFLHAFGDEEKERLEQLATSLGVADAMRWVGYVPYTKMPLFFRGADLMLSVPSSDSSPRSVFESMACGTPAILSHLPWTDHFIEDGINAVLVPPKDSDTLADQIIRLLRSPHERKRISEGALKLVRSRLDYHENMRFVEKTYSELVRRPRNAGILT
jgi:glycosyltransferase involved in cell wall biosynthesis